MTYYDTIEEDLARAKQILAKGRHAPEDFPFLPPEVRAAAAKVAEGFICGADIYAAYKLLESFLGEIERLRQVQAATREPDERAIPGYFRDDGTDGEDITGIPNGFREHIEKVARGEADVETLLPTS